MVREGAAANRRYDEKESIVKTNEEKYQEQDSEPVQWELILLMVLCGILVGVAIWFVIGWLEPPQYPPVAQVAIIDCSTSMTCPNDSYFNAAFNIKTPVEQGDQADGDRGITFNCGSYTQVFQIANSLSVESFEREIKAKAFGEANGRCKKQSQNVSKEFAKWVHDKTSQLGRSKETNILELLESLKRPTKEHRFHIILATDARQSTTQSGLDFDTKPLTDDNFEEKLSKAVGKGKKLKELEKAQIVFVLPQVAVDAKVGNRIDLLERFWKEYLREVEPSAKLVGFSTTLKAFHPEEPINKGGK